MDDEQKARVVAKEPADPYNKHREAPKDPDNLRANGFIPALRFVGKGDSLTSVAGEVKDPALGEFDWQRLARYNWGTAVPAEINWHLLRDCQAGLAPTKSGHNVMFVDGTAHMPQASLWVPHRVDPPAPHLVPVARVDGKVNAAPTLVDTMYCPFLNVAKATCRVAKLRGSPMECWPPSVALRDVPAHDLGKFNSEKAKAAMELQSVKDFMIALGTWSIDPLPAGVSSMKLTEFSVHGETEQSVTEGVERARHKGERSSTASRKPAGGPEIGRLAHSIGMLIDAGKLARVVMRGYETRAELRRILRRVRATRAQAASVMATLQHAYNLPLHDEALGEVDGLIPVTLVGGGGGDAPAGVPSPSHDVVLVDLEVDAGKGPIPDKPEEPPPTTDAHWLFVEVEYEGERCAMLYSSSSGLCRNPMEVTRAKEAAAAYARILLAFGRSETEAGQAMLAAIHGWGMENPDAWPKLTGMLTRNTAQIDVLGTYPSVWLPECSIFDLSKPDAPPNHMRNGGVDVVPVGFDSLRSISESWWKAERLVQLAHRIPV